ncbi:MAG: PqqD family protein [Elusimicrobia bacterium]|nr:PqqD family protein [Elusimicrobiota bacterium]
MAEKATLSKGTWKHSRRIAWRKVGDEAIILDVETAVYFSLSGAGLRMWELLGEGRAAAEIAGVLAEEFDADEDELAEDCAELAAKLQKERLIERA